MSQVTVRRLNADDLARIDGVLMRAFGVNVSFRPSSLELNFGIQPDGWWVAETASGLVGMVGAVRFGPVAYIGLMGVDPEWQGRGIGGQLFGTLVAELDRHGCTTLLLDATPEGELLYRRFGFVEDGMAYDMRRTPPQSSIRPEVALRSPQVHEISTLDREAFGADRRVALEYLLSDPANQALVIENEGYVVAQSWVIGPLIARTPDVAERLLACVSYRPAERMMISAGNEQGVRLIERYGFKVRKEVKHMRRGDAPRGDRRMIYGQASLALG
jgi:ribosomal protein S18 acetylase RimI-like enzyme